MDLAAAIRVLISQDLAAVAEPTGLLAGAAWGGVKRAAAWGLKTLARPLQNRAAAAMTAFALLIRRTAGNTVMAKKESQKPDPARRIVMHDLESGVGNKRIPEVEVGDARDRRQLNVPKDVLDMIDALAEATGHKMTTLLVDALTIYVQLMADTNEQNDLLPSDTQHRLRRLSIEYKLPVGEVLRAAASIGCHLMVEKAEPPGGGSLLGDAVELAEEHGRPAKELIADYVRRGVRADRARAK